MKQKGKKYTFLTVPDVRFEEFYLFNVELKIERVWLKLRID